jgi:hypothetical protein
MAWVPPVFFVSGASKRFNHAEANGVSLLFATLADGDAYVLQLKDLWGERCWRESGGLGGPQLCSGQADVRARRVFGNRRDGGLTSTRNTIIN